jgi:hydroxymethylglutaryl-CoA lyase
MSTVTIVEVGPRDGLQFEPRQLSTGHKVELITRLIDAGLRHVEVGSFVSPRFVPAMADTAAVITGLHPLRHDVRYTVLTPTPRKLEAAMASGIKNVAVFVGASERFNQGNLKRTTAEALNAARAVVERAREGGVAVRGYVSVCFDPDVTSESVEAVAAALIEMGCDDISLGDTTASATPESVTALMTQITQAIPARQLAGHFHDTHNRALANIDAAYACGIRTFDSSIAGLGGCLAADAVTGNVATERLVRHFSRQGIDTGIACKDLDEIAQWVRALLQDVR